MRVGASRPSEQPEPSRRQTGTPRPSSMLILMYVLMTAVAIGLFVAFPTSTATAVSYSEFLAMVGADQVAEVAVAEQRICGTLKKGNQPFEAMRIEDPRLLEELERHVVKFTGAVESTWWTNVTGWLLPLFIMILL